MSKKIALVTAGATIEPIDPVRYISNYSSGKQGYAIAGALQKRGYKVFLISGAVNIQAADNIEIISVKTAEEMLNQCINITSQHTINIAFFVAAVCDWKVEEQSDKKLKKTKNTNKMTLSLVKNPDILSTISNSANRPEKVIGFAAETDDLIANAYEKLKSKNCDYIIANDVSDGVFGSDSNKITIISKTAQHPLPKCTKIQAAEAILDHITPQL